MNYNKFWRYVLFIAYLFDSLTRKKYSGDLGNTGMTLEHGDGVWHNQLYKNNQIIIKIYRKKAFLIHKTAIYLLNV